MIYANHAATSWPKSTRVQSAIRHSIENPPVETGRASINDSQDPIQSCRESICKLFNAPNSQRVILNSGATCSLNYIIDGLLRNGGHVVTTAIEHNSVLRPLYRLQEEVGLEITVTPCSKSGVLKEKDVIASITHNTKAVIISHASNVTGQIINLVEISKTCMKQGAILVVDAAQSAGLVPLDMQSLNIGALVFSGHKGLGGPPGTGGFILADNLSLRPLLVGGTGIKSESIKQPTTSPICYESGTHNTLGICGLMVAVNEQIEQGIENRQKKLLAYSQKIRKGLSEIAGITIYGKDNSLPVISLCLDGISASNLGYILHESCGIVCRSGLHCAPLIHHFMNSSEDGSLRISLGTTNTEQEIDEIIIAVEKLANNLKK